MRSPRLLHRAAVVLSLVTVGIGCASLPDKQPIQTGPYALASDEWRVTDHVILITDGSGTMWVNETFPDAKALTRSFVAAMPERDVASYGGSEYTAGLIGFGGDERTTAPSQPFDRSALSSTAARLEVMGDIAGTGGTTPYAAVLTETANMLQGKRGRAAVVIFSDGVPDDEPAALFAARKLVESHPDGVCIYGVHTGLDEEGYEFLKKLASLSGCGSVQSASSIGSAYEVQQLARAVLVGPANRPPPVAAAGPCEGVMRLRGIEFAFDRSRIQDDSKPVLDVAADQLRRCPDIRVTISGYTDSTGPESYNANLSHRRAKAARDYLVESGISASRFEVEGRGESDPIASNETREGRAQNRRVELAPIQ
jgi:outer membrane protein OmpA-like peptidoglycan-associated protein